MVRGAFDLRSTYLNTSYMGPMPNHARKMVETALDQAADPAALDFESRKQYLVEVRSRLANLLGVNTNSVAISTSVSELIGHIANGLPLTVGDDVIVMEGDYPSMVLPWMVAAENRGFELRRLPREVFQHPEKLKREIKSRTRFVGCSHVMFNTGLQLPIAELGRVCRQTGALFFADTSQSFGGMRITPDMIANVDGLIGVAYKWLLGPYGSAYGYFSDRALESIRRTHASWLVSANSQSTEFLLDYTTKTIPGACRFDRGESPTYLINAALSGALSVLQQVGLASIESHNLSLAREFMESLPKGFDHLSDREYLTPIICVKPRAESAAQCKQRLAEAHVDVSLREGYLRFAFHFFNSSSQVQAVVGILSQ